MISLRVPRPPRMYFDSFGFASKRHSSVGLPSLPSLASKLYSQPSPPANTTCGTPPSVAMQGLDHWPCRMLSPGEASVQMILPVCLFTHRKLGALGAGRFTCVSSTPLLVQTNSRSPRAPIEQLHMLCCETPSSFIMSYDQMTSASSLSSTVMIL